MVSSAASHRSATAPPLTDLLTALSQPACYPHHPAHVEVVQTHISVVFLAGEAVYKLKKPVRFSFLDYSTLALRHHCCQEEVRLNRRLAPTVYLGVVPVLYTGEAYRVREAVNMRDAAVVDYLVRMRRLPPERTLDALIAAGRVAKEGIHLLAKRLVHFHNTAATKDAAVYGAPEVIWQALADNFQETAPFIGHTISDTQYTLIQDFSQRFFTEHQELFKQRIIQDRVRDGHGDLRGEHVYFLDEGLTIIDCIEFSPRLRTCDVASELAFLAMDLELHGAPALAAELVQTYAVQAEDENFLRLLSFYQCYRAYVRGKVESLKSREPEVPRDEQERARRQARRAFRLEFTTQTYTALRTQAEEELRAGRGVIVDATCKQREDRRALLELGGRLGRPVLFLECRASAAEVERRLREREQRGDSASDATWAIALQEQYDFPSFNDIPEQCHFVIDTEQDLEDALVGVEERLSERKP